MASGSESKRSGGGGQQDSCFNKGKNQTKLVAEMAATTDFRSVLI